MCAANTGLAKCRRRFAAGLLAIACLGASPAAARDWRGELVIDGGASVSLVDWYGVGALSPERALVERFPWRLTARAWSEDGIAMELAYEATASIGATRTGSGSGVGRNTSLRIADPRERLVNDGTRVLRQNLDRLNLFVERDWGQMTIGRQALSHGSGRFFNPSDIFAPVSPQTTVSEFKQGVDALRLTRVFGDRAEAELYLVAHEDGWRRSYKLGRLRYMFTAAEASLMAGTSLGEPTLAADLSGNLGGAVWYGEAVVRFDAAPLDRLRATAGIHNRFDVGSGLDAFAELHFNGVGRDDPDDYARVRASPEWVNGEVFVTGRWFTAVSLAYDLHPLVTASFAYVQSLTDGSLLLLPAIAWEATESVTLKAGVSLGLGARPDADPRDPTRRTAIANSEFGAYPNIVFVELRFTY